MNKVLVSIRGAVTASNDIRSITEHTVKLVDSLFFKNGLSNSDVVNMTFSTTPDITAFYPARAAREAGYDVPLFSCVEPDIDGSISGCIRVMITAWSAVPPFNKYLNGARALRKDLTEAYSIALDGPSGAGKSTVAKMVAGKLGITYLDTGALYRVLGLVALRNGIDTKDALAVEKCLKPVSVGIKYQNGVQAVFADDEDVSGLIRTPEVSMAASNVSAIPFVREKLLSIQRETANVSAVILDGRDIGTVVLPKAEFKYYLTASAEVRARRRYDELTAKGQNVTYNEVLNDVNRRDKNDMSRAVAPLKKAFDAVEIDSDGLTAEQVADKIIADVTGDM